MKLCSFNDPSGETAVAATAASNRKGEEQTRVEDKTRKEKAGVTYRAHLTFLSFKQEICKFKKKMRNWLSVHINGKSKDY